MNFDELVETLAVGSTLRYETAIDEGSTPLEAMREIIRTILIQYQKRLAQ
jgi:hypothetical protein